MVTVRVPLASRPIRYGVVIAVAAFILVSSVVEPGTTTTESPFGVFEADKWFHAVAYAALTATLAYAAAAPESHRNLVFVVCLAVAFGIAVELVQWPIPYRTASALDALADAVGASLLALCWWWGRRFVRFVPIGELSESIR